MGRPSGTKNKMMTPEEKEKIVLEYLNGKVGYRMIARSHDIYSGVLFEWINKYKNQGIEGLKSNTGTKKGGNKGKGNKKCQTREEELERENLRLKIQIERLKKGYYVKGAGQKKEYISINNRSSKSLEN